MFKGVIEWDIFLVNTAFYSQKCQKKGHKRIFCDWGIISKTSTQQTPEILGHATIFFSPNARDPRDPVTDGSRLES